SSTPTEAATPQSGRGQVESEFSIKETARLPHSWNHPTKYGRGLRYLFCSCRLRVRAPKYLYGHPVPDDRTAADGRSPPQRVDWASLRSRGWCLDGRDTVSVRAAAKARGTGGGRVADDAHRLHRLHHPDDQICAGAGL